MPKLISSEGSIAAGKSTLISILEGKNYEDLIILKEPVDEWLKIQDSNKKSLFEHFYEDKKKYGFSLQIYALFTRFKLLAESFEIAEKWEIKNPGREMKILAERTILSDFKIFASLLHEEGIIEELNFQIYKSWFEYFSEKYKIDKIIYLKTDPKICFDRIKTRDRDGEDNIESDYLNKIHQKHEDMIKECECEILILQNENNIDSLEYDEIIKKSIEFIFS
uniref:Deoxynucleoside kinase domain-containing protein n=1 Tax=viral metagenome TaxID=1070528 RepID=A0A6C0AF74_9ZZZZ